MTITGKYYYEIDASSEKKQGELKSIKGPFVKGNVISIALQLPTRIVRRMKQKNRQRSTK